MMTGKITERPHDGEVRCIACFARFWVKEGVEKGKCPGCGIEWRISRPYPRAAKVRRSDWEICPTGDKI